MHTLLRVQFNFIPSKRFSCKSSHISVDGTRIQWESNKAFRVELHMDTFCHPIKSDLRSAVDSSRERKRICECCTHSRDCNELTSLTFCQQGIHGFKKDHCPDDIDLKVFFEGRDIDFSDFLPIVGNSGVCYNNVQSSSDPLNGDGGSGRIGW